MSTAFTEVKIQMIKRHFAKLLLVVGLLCADNRFARAEENPESADCNVTKAVAARSAEAGKVGPKDIPNTCLNVGSKAAEFALPDAQGKDIKLSDLLAKGPVVLAFYRGSWCPFCNRELHGLQEILPQIQAQSATLVAISPQTPDSTAATVSKDGLAFEVLSDVGNHTAKAYGLVYAVPKLERPFYVSLGANLPKYNGDDSFQLPLPATYVIDKTGQIKYAFVDVDYKKRLSPEDILKQLTLLSDTK